MIMIVGDSSFEWIDETDKQGRKLVRVRETFDLAITPEARISIPKDYVSNLGSIPRALYFLVSPSDIGPEAIVHDYLTREYFGIGPRPAYTVPRSIADAFFRELLLSNKSVPRWRAKWVYAAVRFWARKNGIEE